MGSCFSFITATANASQTPPTAKVVTPSGALWEFSSPVKSSLVVDEPSSFFVCDSDCLLFDERVPALKPEEPLLPGHLYFILPAEKQEFSLTGDEMAELAVRASAALMTSNKNVAGKKKKKNKKKKSRIVPGDGADHADVCVDDIDVGETPLRPVVRRTKVVQRSRSTRARVAPASTSGSNLGTIEEGEEAEA